ncbi:MAG TPA: hypothetical protein DCS24_09675 [Erythrobacter sp.]|nr:hypothetical protein [Erythrobacter sp.]
MILRTLFSQWCFIAFAAIMVSTLAYAGTQAEADDASGTEVQDVDPELVAAALKSSPEGLGVSFLVNRYMIKLADLATEGIQIQTPEGVIDKRSATVKKRESERRLHAYRQAILQRGFDDLSGVYRIASVTPSCADSRSLWLSGAVEGIFEKFEFSQRSFEFALSITPTIESGIKDDIGTLDLEGVVVESNLVIEDPINSDYFLEGESLGERIEIRPRLDVLKGWPSWASPPKKRDLKNCKLVLERHESE